MKVIKITAGILLWVLKKIKVLVIGFFREFTVWNDPNDIHQTYNAIATLEVLKYIVIIGANTLISNISFNQKFFETMKMYFHRNYLTCND